MDRLLVVDFSTVFGTHCCNKLTAKVWAELKLLYEAEQIVNHFVQKAVNKVISRNIRLKYTWQISQHKKMTWHLYFLLEQSSSCHRNQKKKKKKWPRSRIICNGIPLDIMCTQICSEFVFYQVGKWGIVLSFLCLFSQISNWWMYKKVWESHWKQITYHLSKKKFCWLCDFCHRLQRPQVGWDESLSTGMIHICHTRLLHANQ